MGGGVTSRRVSLFMDTSDCAFAFEAGHHYVVFARRDAEGRPTTSVCMRTSDADRAQAALKALRPLEASEAVKKGCGLTLVLWLALVGACGYVAFQKIHELFPSAMIGVLSGTFASALVGSFIGLFTGAGSRPRGPPPGDEWGGDARRAAQKPPPVGIRPRARRSNLRSPAGHASPESTTSSSRRRCKRVCRFRARARAIQTIRGPVRVFGWAMLDSFFPDGFDAIDRARGAGDPSDRGVRKLGVTSILSVMGELMAEEDRRDSERSSHRR